MEAGPRRCDHRLEVRRHPVVAAAIRALAEQTTEYVRTHLPKIYTVVAGVRPCLRVEQDGFTLRETVADYVQIVPIDPFYRIRFEDGSQTTQASGRRPNSRKRWRRFSPSQSSSRQVHETSAVFPSVQPARAASAARQDIRAQGMRA